MSTHTPRFVSPEDQLKKYSKETRDFVETGRRSLSLTLEGYRNLCVKDHGSFREFLDPLEQEMSIGLAEYRKHFPSGGPPLLHLERQPLPSEPVSYIFLTDDIALRLFNGKERVEPTAGFCFDFVDKYTAKRIRTPPGVFIFSEATGSGPCSPVLSIEKSLEKHSRHSNALAYALSSAAEIDPDWETFVVAQGTLLRITGLPGQRRNDPFFIEVPIRPRGRTLTWQDHL